MKSEPKRGRVGRIDQSYWMADPTLPSFSSDCNHIVTVMKVSELKTAVAQIVTEGNVVLEHKRARLARLSNSFLQNYGDGEVILLRAPARINILGEHIDYVSYLPTASLTFGSRERDALMLYRTSSEARVQSSSTSPGYESSSFSLSEDHPPHFGQDVAAEWLAFLTQHGTPEPHWQNYIQGAVSFARGKFGERVVNGFDFVVDSNIPAGGGASSSSALVVLSGAAIREVNRITYTAEELAQDSAVAEWYIGTRGGSMDHTTICLAQRSTAVLINYSTHQTRRLAVPDTPFEWITFFSQPANKGREVMIEYNERAAISRVVIPAIVDKWKDSDPEVHRHWLDSLRSFSSGNLEALNTTEQLVMALPERISIDFLRTNYSNVYSELERSFPALLNESSRWPLSVRTRALHHLGEMRRVARAAQTLESLQGESTAELRYDAMVTIGGLLDESHASLRDLYNVSTAEVERLIEIIRSDRQVLGARLMGGGFGGNVLALTTIDHAQKLIERVETNYYRPRDRDGTREGSIMVSTPGEGLARIDLNNLWRESVTNVNSLDSHAASHLNSLRSLLDTLPIDLRSNEIWPVIVAAGKGQRASASGLGVPKPVAPVVQEAAIVHLLKNIRAGLGETQPPVIIVSKETESSVREVLPDQTVIYVKQENPLGTGDAVLNAKAVMKDFKGLALVVWSTQPVIRPGTFARATKLARLFDDFAMIVPTTFRQHPYAPIQRNQSGEVQSARETHLESATPLEFGETNIGMFLLKNETMFNVLQELREKYWNASAGKYNRSEGELGFPNELINALAPRPHGVFASPIADAREEQGIKRLDDVSTCETYIAQLEKEELASM